MKVKILISGLAIICQVPGEEFWKIVFLCDAAHPLNFRDSQGGSNRQLFNGQDGSIVFSHEGKITSSLGRGTDYDKIFNIASSRYGHGADTLRVNRTGTWKVFTMLIPSAVLGMEPHSGVNYVVKDYPFGGNRQEIGEIAKVICAEIDLDDSGGLTMIIDDGTGSTVIKHYDSDTELRFDNDCHVASKSADDFLEYYYWLEDTVHRGRKFVAGKAPLLIVQDTDKLDKGVEFSSDQGNCDPIIIDPPI